MTSENCGKGRSVRVAIRCDGSVRAAISASFAGVIRLIERFWLASFRERLPR
ncbi:MAG TPA: hypothetical protein VJ302_27915 [Blastocatellia bacterium]|nr:hypothetical protein [Blastocatellia bacterium]